MSIEKNYFTLPATFLDKYWTDRTLEFSKGWTWNFNSLFETINNKCVLRFLYHKINYGNGRKFTPFIAAAECKMRDCCKYKFAIHEPLKNGNDHTVQVLTVAGT